MQPQAGKGTKTTTHHINGATYQARLVPCGKRGHCSTCREDGGHSAVYMDSGQPRGARWQYIGNRLPDVDPTYQIPTCQRDGCDNPTPRRSQRYCSARCRVAAHRAAQ